MPKQLTIDDARQSLNAHLAAKGAEIQEKYGPRIGWSELTQLLGDRSRVRYPCEIRFDASQLLAGEFAHPVASTNKPEDGFIIFVHPVYATNLDRVAYLVLYQLVLVNYGEFASNDDAETFGAHALGLAKYDYYHSLVEMVDQITNSEPSHPSETNLDCAERPVLSSSCNCRPT